IDLPHPHSSPTRRSSDLTFSLSSAWLRQRYLPDRHYSESARSGLDKSCPNRISRELQPIPHPELLKDVRAVPVDGLHADEERRGDRKSTRLNSSYVKISY